VFSLNDMRLLDKPALKTAKKLAERGLNDGDAVGAFVQLSHALRLAESADGEDDDFIRQHVSEQRGHHGRRAIIMPAHNR